MSGLTRVEKLLFKGYTFLNTYFQSSYVNDKENLLHFGYSTKR